MKSRKLIIALALTLYWNPSTGQNLETRATIPLNDIHVLVIENIDGKSTPIRSNTDELIVHSENQLIGETWGWRSPKERPPFIISTKQFNDTLFLILPRELAYKSVGINTYSEQITNLLQIPSEMKIVIRDADLIEVESEFEYLDIRQAVNLSIQSFSKQNISNLQCRAFDMMSINDIKRSNAFEMQGIGRSYYHLEANKISINLK